ncbi:MAG: hypothetical protein IBJ11_05910 [Phycisphaerales bacterium]|nr:hypothetical protein [Phycisphaerales bacterium]
MKPRAPIPASARRAFTLLELLVVIGVIVFVTFLLVPAFGRIIESAQYTAAINTVQAALGNARAQAIRTGRPTAVAFLFDPASERFTLQVLELAGQQSGTLSTFATFPTRATYAQPFRPALGSTPIELPKGTGVYGLAFNLSDDPNSGDYRIDSNTFAWYAGEVCRSGGQRIIPWLFPRNDPRNFTDLPADDQNAWSDTNLPRASVAQAVRHANSFFVQFDADGAVSTSTKAGGQNIANAYIEFTDGPVDANNSGTAPYDNPLAFDPESRGTAGNIPAAFSPNPEVVLRSVYQLAVVDLRALSKGTGIERPWLVRATGSAAPRASNVIADDVQALDISAWIENNAEIIGFNRYTGNAIRKALP